MLSTKPLRVLPGGVTTIEQKTAPHYPHRLIGLATFKKVNESPQIVEHLTKVHSSFEYLPGQIVGVLSIQEDSYTIDRPRIDKSTFWSETLPIDLFAHFEPAPDSPFADLDLVQDELQRRCLKTDRIVALTWSLVEWPHAGKPGLDRLAALIWLASSAGHNKCEVCESEILRHVFDDAECQHYGPARQRCHLHVEK
ncbi:MAG: hypothetical protein U0517_03870 [Candidatus Andersenbacteria bacterium]